MRSGAIKRSKNGLENDGFYIIWKFSGNPTPIVIIPGWYIVGAYKPHRGPYFIRVDTL
jgi:hypothetical protein